MKTTLKGNPVTLNGTLLAVGASLPDFNLTKGDLSDVTKANFAGKTKILLTVPSLDTGLCAKEARTFNEKAGRLAGVEVIVASRDLPFAQKRFCEAAGIDRVTTVSDLHDPGFAERLGVQIGNTPMKGLMARAVFVVGADDKVKYMELVPEITTEPNYEAALAAASK